MASTREPRPPRTLAPGDELTDEVSGERYRVRSLIGQGGMGRVFEAEAASTGAIVAVKCNQEIDATNQALVERTRREGGFLKQLRRHPHIVPVLATGMRGDGLFWMVMPLLDGASVGGLLSVLGRIPLPWALRIAQAVCSALAEAHRYALHRDIKPENVFVTRDGGIFVLDFGAGKFYAVRRLTTTGTTIGTIAYSSPEQLTDPDHLDERSDLFAVGVLTFEMLAGAHPFDAEGPLQGHAILIGNRIIREPPRPLDAFAPGLPSYMTAVIEKLLEKDRDRRSRNAAEAERVFGAAVREIASRHGEPPPIQRIFEAYDEARRAQELARLATQETERAAVEKRSGPRPRFGTVPLAAFVAPAPPVGEAAPIVAAPIVAAPIVAAPIAVEPVGGTVPIGEALVAQMVEGVVRPPHIEAAVPAAVVEAVVPAPVVEAVVPAAAVAPAPLVEAVVPAAVVEAAPAAVDPFEVDPWPVPPGVDQERAHYLVRKLKAMERLLSDPTPETRAILLDILRDHDEESVLRAGAGLVLESIGDEACLDALQECAATDPNAVVRRMLEGHAVKLAWRLGVPVVPLPSVPVDARASRPPASMPQEGSVEPPVRPVELSVRPVELRVGLVELPVSSVEPAVGPVVVPGTEPVSPWVAQPLAVRGGRELADPEWSTLSLVLLAFVSALLAAGVVLAVLYFLMR